MTSSTPSRLKDAKALADNHIRLAKALQGRGDSSRALSLHEEACRLHEELLRRSPHEARRKWDVAVSYDSLGKWHKQFGDPQAALAAFERARDIWLELLQENPSWAQVKRRLAATWFHLRQFTEAVCTRQTN